MNSLYKDKWNKTENSLPTQDKWVEVITPNGDQVKMRRLNNLWFYQDGLYAYFTPLMWREIRNE